MTLVRWLALAAGLCACTPAEMHRTHIGRWDASRCTPVTDTRPPDECAKASIEHHVLAQGAGDYLLGVVEFDDQGWFQHGAQMNVLLEELEREASEQDVIVSVFVHGWKHGADYCDANIGCFRELLRHIVTAEQEYHRQLYSSRGRTDVKPRKVIGVYVAWRGLSVGGPDILRSTTFWDRKAVAAQVAQGSVRELFARLRTFQEKHNDPDWIRAHVKDGAQRAMHPRNRLFVLGHSFGGLIVYTSVAQALMNNAIAPRSDERSSRVPGFGDLVVLVNPAFEGARYEALHHISQTRHYGAGQDPVFIAVTSTDDDATAKAFRYGRFFSTLLETTVSSPATPRTGAGQKETHTAAEEQNSSVRAIGHIPRYITHDLVHTQGTPELSLARERQVNCGCPYADELRDANRVDWAKETQLAREFAASSVHAGHRVRGWERKYNGNISLRHLGRSEDPAQTDELDADSPFWIVRTSKPIVTDHNDFWSPHLFNFLRQVYDDKLRTLEAAPAPAH